MAELLSAHRDALTLMSPAQLAGILDVNVRFALELPIPRIELAPKVIRYRVADVESYLSKNTVHPGRPA